MFQICTALGWSGTSQACHGTCIFTTRRCHGLRSKGQSHFGAHATTTVVSGNLSQPVGWERWTGEAKYCTVTNLALTCSHPRLWVRMLHTALIPPPKNLCPTQSTPTWLQAASKLHPEACIASAGLLKLLIRPLSLSLGPALSPVCLVLAIHGRGMDGWPIGSGEFPLTGLKGA